MTLFEIVKQNVNLGYTIRFTREINQLVIMVKYISIKNETYQKESCLPLSDHFYEERVVDCIFWMINEIENLKKQDK